MKPAASTRHPASPAAGGDATPPALELYGLSKSFGKVRVLHDVDLVVRAGEIHGLLGQNGSGKSTLIKVLAGFHDPAPGARLTVAGRPVPLPLAPGAYQSLGIRFVHQDLGLIPSLTVLDNLLIERFSTGRSWGIRWSEERRRARRLFADYGLRIDPDALVSSLRPVERALLAIVRATGSMLGAQGDGGVLVLDEPTVFLPRDDTELLFDLARRVAATGAGVLFVSHDLDEVAAITDRVTVLRDGHVVGAADTASLGHDDLVQMIVGHQIDAVTHVAPARLRAAPVAVTASGIGGGLVDRADLTVHEGEILGITGLSGSGFEDVPYLLFGLVPGGRGELSVGGTTVGLDALTPSRAFRAGLALVPGDRQKDGAVLSLTVLDNVSMQMLDRYQRGPVLRRGALARDSREVLRRFDVRPADPALTYGNLSGGNQQKVLMAKWLQTRPRVLLVHEPTQGVDVGAREEIYGVLRSAAGQKMAVICASSDHEQLSLICDRVLIFRQGRIVAEVTGSAITKNRISELCYGTTDGTGRGAA